MVDIYEALAVQTRREIIEIIAKEKRIPASAIYKRFSTTPQAISQHLKILRDAKLVQVEKSGQKRLYSINPLPFKDMDTWIVQMTQVWSERFDALDNVLKEQQSI